MTAFEYTDTAVARPDIQDKEKTHLQRRSSFQKIMHICNQGYAAFPHILIRLKDPEVSLDFGSLVLQLRSMFLNVAVFLAIATLFSQFLVLFAAGVYYLKGPFFLTGCVFVLGVVAFRCLTCPVADRVHRSLSCRKKID